MLPWPNPAGISARSPRLRVSASPCLFLLLTLTLAPNTRAQTNFNSGSDGSYGAMNITNDITLDLPADGIFRCTTINVASGVTLSFNRNALNTPVYLLATNDVTISGIIDVSGWDYNSATPGAGGPGGFDGGLRGAGDGVSAIGGDGYGPGGGKNLDIYAIRGGVFGSVTAGNTNTYANTLLTPLIGGSGGAGFNNFVGESRPGGTGGGGGGALLIASNTRITLNGQLSARGGIGYGGGGSGGGVRLVAPFVTGTGIINAAGGANIAPFYSPGNGSGGGGRIRIDCPDRYSYQNITVPGGFITGGRQMFVFPPVRPRLDILAAAGQTIPEGSPNGVQIILPGGSSTNQLVTVQARDFTNNVPIRVVVAPDHGPSAAFDATINMSAGNPAQTNVSVVLSPNNLNRIYVWTR